MQLSRLPAWLARPPPASLSTFHRQAFICDDFDDGSSYLRADYKISCDDDDEYSPVFRLAWAAITVYCIGVPLMYALLLASARNAILSGRPSTLSKALSFLHRDAKPRAYWWEIAETASKAERVVPPGPRLAVAGCGLPLSASTRRAEQRGAVQTSPLLPRRIVKKLFLCGFAVLIKPGETLQLAIGFIFCLAYFLFCAVVHPYGADEDNFFLALCNFVLTTILFMCMLLKQVVITLNYPYPPPPPA